MQIRILVPWWCLSTSRHIDGNSMEDIPSWKLLWVSMGTIFAYQDILQNNRISRIFKAWRITIVSLWTAACGCMFIDNIGSYTVASIFMQNKIQCWCIAFRSNLFKEVRFAHDVRQWNSISIHTTSTKDDSIVNSVSNISAKHIIVGVFDITTWVHDFSKLEWPWLNCFMLFPVQHLLGCEKVYALVKICAPIVLLVL